MAAGLGCLRDDKLTARLLCTTPNAFADDGLEVDIVAGRAGAGKAAIYRRWPSDPGLIRGRPDHVHDGSPVSSVGTLRDDLLTLFD